MNASSMLMILPSQTKKIHVGGQVAVSDDTAVNNNILSCCSQGQRQEFEFYRKVTSRSMPRLVRGNLIQCTLDLVTHLVCQKTVTKSRVSLNKQYMKISGVSLSAIFMIRCGFSNQKIFQKKKFCMYVLQIHLCIYLAWRLLSKYVNKSYFDNHWT